VTVASCPLMADPFRLLPHREVVRGAPSRSQIFRGSGRRIMFMAAVSLVALGAVALPCWRRGGGASTLLAPPTPKCRWIACCAFSRRHQDQHPGRLVDTDEAASIGGRANRLLAAAGCSVRFMTACSARSAGMSMLVTADGLTTRR